MNEFNGDEDSGQLVHKSLHNAAGDKAATSCTFKKCIKGLLEPGTSLTKSQKQHVQGYHTSTIHTVTIRGVELTFKRNDKKDMYYVCPCNSQHVCFSSLKTHILGSEHTTMNRKPCTKIAEEIQQVLETGEPRTKDNPGFEAARTTTENDPVALATADESTIDQDLNGLDIFEKHERVLKRAIDELNEARLENERLKQQYLRKLLKS